MLKSLKLITLSLAFFMTVSSVPSVQGAEKWQQLFNGKNLDGWTPKIRGYEYGENFGNTFRVKDGVMQVGYEAYGPFKERFGHIFYKTPYSNYRFRVEYRFFGDQSEEGPGWAFRNSGVMVHCQDPKTMTKGQSFPVSIEVQLLGGSAQGERTTSKPIVFLPSIR